MITSKNIKNGYIDFNDINLICKEDYEAINKRSQVDEGDIIMPMIGTIGNPVIVKKERDFAIKNVALIKFYKDTKINRYYLREILASEFINQRFINESSGSTQKFIPLKYIRNLDIPLPPLPAQEEIVAEIESYQKIIDGARQVVENYKPRIDIDPEWEMVDLGEVCLINPKKSEIKDLPLDLEVSFVPMADINENHISFVAKQSKPLQEVFKSYTYFRNDDVLLARVTPCFENGKAGIASNLKNGIGFGSSEYTVIRCSEKVLPTWIYVWVTTDSFRNTGKLHMTGTGGLQRVPNDFISNYEIPVPDVKTQEDIITQIHSEQEIIESNKKLIQIYEQKITDRIAKVWGQ